MVYQYSQVWHRSAIIPGDLESIVSSPNYCCERNMLLVLAVRNIESVGKELRLWETWIIGNVIWRDTCFIKADFWISAPVHECDEACEASMCVIFKMYSWNFSPHYLLVCSRRIFKNGKVSIEFTIFQKFNKGNVYGPTSPDFAKQNIQYIPRNMHTVLLCFALLWLCNRS